MEKESTITINLPISISILSAMKKNNPKYIYSGCDAGIKKMLGQCDLN